MSDVLPRIKPQPLPPIYPHWEYLAEGDLHRIYEEYKRVFQVPWVGVVSMAYAHYPHFFNTWYKGLREVVESAAYVECARSLRQYIETTINALEPPSISQRLREKGYSSRELSQIEEAIEFFSHGNFSQIPAVFAARTLLEGIEIGAGNVSATKFEGQHGVDVQTPFILMEPHHVAAETTALYQNIMETLQLPFVNTDYRALARWPSYLELSWNDLRDHIDTPEYSRITQNLHDRICHEVERLPNPNNLTSSHILAAARQDGDVDKILQMTRLFTYLLPGLVTNVAYFRAQFKNPANG